MAVVVDPSFVWADGTELEVTIRGNLQGTTMKVPLSGGAAIIAGRSQLDYEGTTVLR